MPSIRKRCALVPADPVLVIDAGTSSLRAVAVTPGGQVSIVAEAAWPMFTPADGEPFGREFEAREVLASLGGLLDRAKGGRFGAVAFTGQREGLVFLDEQRKPLLISPNVDARASAEGIEIDAQHAGGVYAVTGHLPSLVQASPFGSRPGAGPTRIRVARASRACPATPVGALSGRRDSNPRPQPWQGCALPTEPRPQRASAYQSRTENRPPGFPRPGRIGQPPATCSAAFLSSPSASLTCWARSQTRGTASLPTTMPKYIEPM